MLTLSPTGSIILIPQLYLDYKFKSIQFNSHHEIFSVSVAMKFFYLVLQILCIPYFLRTGLFWILAKHYPFAILGHLINAIVSIAMIYQHVHPEFYILARSVLLVFSENSKSQSSF